MQVIDSFVSVLLVEPEMFAQLELLDVIRSARARVELTCVSTCGGALHALDRDDIDCVLLSTSLSSRDAERRELAALLHAASSRGVAVVSIGPAPPGGLGAALHESLTYDDVALGRLDTALEQALTRAAADRALAVLAEQDRLALSGRAWGNMLPFSVEQSLGGPVLASVDLEAVLERALDLAGLVSGVRLEKARRYSGELSLAVDEGLVCQLLLNMILALVSWQGAEQMELILSTWSFEEELVVEINAPGVELPVDAAAAVGEPFSVVNGVSGLGLWSTRHLLARWSARVELGTPAGGGTSFLVAFPASLRRSAAPSDRSRPAACA